MKALDGFKLCFSIIKTRRGMYFAMVALEVAFMYLADVFFALLNRGVVNSVTNMDFGMFKASLWFAAFAMGAYILNVVVRFFKIKSIRRIMQDIRCRLFRHMEFLSVGYYEKNHSADSIFRLNSNVENIKRALANSFPNIAHAMLGGAASCAFILMLDLRLGLLSLATCVVTFVINLKFAAPLRGLGREIQRGSDLLAGFRIIKLFDIDGASVRHYDEANDSVAEKRIRRISKMGALGSISNLLNFINNFVLITAGAVMAALGYCDFGTVFAILSVQGNVSGMLLTFGNSWGMMQESIAAAELISDIFAQERETRALYL